jgi:benzodiazapine receptor
MKPVTGMRSILALAGWLLVTFCAPVLGAFSGPGEWYRALNKPSWNPPGWVFGPVWTGLYVLMAVAAWLVWRRGGWQQQGRPLRLYGVQLALNAAWTPLFFGLKMPGVALVEIGVLWVTIGLTIRAFRGVSGVAAALLVPYWLWVSFATVLNATLWWMNR